MPFINVIENDDDDDFRDFGDLTDTDKNNTKADF